MKVGVIDYGVGNLGSVVRALEHVNSEPSLITQPADLDLFDCLILPGVGSFTDCARLLGEGGWIDPITSVVVESKRPLLGICVGMQLLADFGMEGATGDGIDGTPGFGFIAGKVQHMSSLRCNMRLPHVGWNEISVAEPQDSLFADIPDKTDFYFTHSYSFTANNPADVIATTGYGVPVTAAVRHGNVWGTQFHPEKSSKAGFKLLMNFLASSSC
jgi:imidazole glycerol-phosphate synthase subunit HisH